MSTSPRILALLLSSAALLPLGCQSTKTGKLDPDEQRHQSEEAVDLTEKAAKGIEAFRNRSEPTGLARLATPDDEAKVLAEALDKAEKQLKEALALDPNLGPAHNNLGTVYFMRKQYYDAAWEYKLAGKLMPTLAEPVGNLGHVFEAAGKWNDAVESYEQALRLDPDSFVVRGNLARTLTRKGDHGQRTVELLKEVAFKDPRPEWQKWARLEVERRGGK